MGILLSVLFGVLLLVNGIACSMGSEDRKQIYVFNLLVSLFTLILVLIFRVDWQALLQYSYVYTEKVILLLVLSGLCGLGYAMMLMFAMNTGPHALTLSIGESCLVIPYLYSVIVWKDPVSPLGIVGFILLAVSFIAIGFTKEKDLDKKDFSNKWFILILTAFLLGGAELTLYTIPNRLAGFEDPANLRPALIQVGRMVMFIPILAKKIKPQKKTAIISLIAAVFNVFVAVIQFMAMDYLAKDQMMAVLYPIGMGTYILLFTAYGFYYRKERLSTPAWLSMAAIVTGIVLLCF
jgi:drug/metabolite transporter (DMT)-like permease